MKYSRRARKQEEASRIIEDPSLFARILLGQDIWSKQDEILQALAKFPRTAVKACHASGKTHNAAAAVLWWITRYKEAVAVTTAPTWTQVERLLWGEIHSAVYRAKIAFPKPNATSLQLGPGRYAIGLSTNEGVRFQGFHGNVLIVLDEAPGILPEILKQLKASGQAATCAYWLWGIRLLPAGPSMTRFPRTVRAGT